MPTIRLWLLGDSRSEREGYERSNPFMGKVLQNLSQRPSRSPSSSPQISLDRIHKSPSATEGFTQEQTDVDSDRISPEYDQEPPSNTDETQAALGVGSQGVEDLPSLGNQETDPVGQGNGSIIEDLDLDILEVIGKRVAEVRVLAPSIPRSIAVRLEDILKKGLPKEEKEKLIKEHAPPKNCVLIDPPKLNEEIKVSVSETATKRDDRIVEKQKKISACLALLGSAVVDVINNEKSDNLKVSDPQMALIRKLSEAARLMADLQRDETLTRRSLILAAISSLQRETLDSVTADEWLFGHKLGERLKAAKTIEKSGKDLKVIHKNCGRSKNSKIPPRRQPFRSRTWGGYRNKTYNQNQSYKRTWRNLSGRDRSSFRSQAVTDQQKKA
ncbi:hypothetical protein ACS0PU_009128 [Formica fusca]